MGNLCPKMFKRIFEYPIKKKPICFLRQDDFSSTGEPLPKREPVPQGHISEYDKLVHSFYSRLMERYPAHMEEAERKEKSEGVPSEFAGWDKLTISNLQSLFVMFDKKQIEKISFDDFVTILDSLGDTSSNDYRKIKFDEMDPDLTGWLSYEDYLHIIYNFNEQGGKSLKGLAKLCKVRAADIKFVGSLTMNEQIEYGLF